MSESKRESLGTLLAAVVSSLLGAGFVVLALLLWPWLIDTAGQPGTPATLAVHGLIVSGQALVVLWCGAMAVLLTYLACGFAVEAGRE